MRVAPSRFARVMPEWRLIFCLLKLARAFLVFEAPRLLAGLANGCRRVSDALISMLLQGGCGHENLRLLSPLPLHRRLRPAVRHARPDARRTCAELAAL